MSIWIKECIVKIISGNSTEPPLKKKIQKLPFSEVRVSLALKINKKDLC